MKCISIDGRSGSGKTYLANALAEKLGARVIHLDDFGNDYEPFVGIPKLLEELDRTNDGVIIVEGVGVFDDRLTRFHPFRILVNTGSDIRRKRIAGRDVPSNDRTADDWNTIADLWAKAEDLYFTDAVKQRADVVTNENGAPDIDDILRNLTERFLMK